MTRSIRIPPPLYDEVLDAVHMWGRYRCPQWEQAVLHWMWHRLTPMNPVFMDDFQIIHYRSREDVFENCFMLMVEHYFGHFLPSDKYQDCRDRFIYHCMFPMFVNKLNNSFSFCIKRVRNWIKDEINGKHGYYKVYNVDEEIYEEEMVELPDDVVPTAPITGLDNIYLPQSSPSPEMRNQILSRNQDMADMLQFFRSNTLFGNNITGTPASQASTA